jgi:ABC-type branched-subunit amino acid transport system substrate-binding protein
MLHRGRFQTVIGPVAFDDKGDLVGATWQWFAWRDGDYRPLGWEVARRVPRALDRRPANP